jgi:2-desacetyl-2-hydroxyethyl bacteriochlorophyllide A dehydrogenase
MLQTKAREKSSKLRKGEFSMKGCFFLGNKKFEVREMEEKPLKPDEVRIKVMACGVCGTDVHIYNGEPGSAEVVPPVVLGHEYAGIVEEIGSGVTTLAVGDHVTVDPNMYCGNCVPCRDGKKQFCKNLQALGVNCNGGFAEYNVAPEKQCFKLNPKLDITFGAMAEPLACCLHGIDHAGIRPGDTVCVIGGGAIGLLMVQLAKLSGAARVILSEPVALRRKVGLSVGADLAVNPMEENLPAAICEASGKGGADVVIECVGNNAAARSAIQSAGFGATVLFFSVPAPDAKLDLPMFDVYKKELQIRGSFINPNTHLRAVELLNSGRIDIKPIITHTFSLNHVEDAILMQKSAESIKVIVKPNEII